MVPALCGPPLPAISSSRPEGSSGYFHCNIQHFHSQPSLKPEPMSTTKKSNFPLEPPSCPVPGAAGWAGHYQPWQTPDPVLSHTLPPTSCSIQAGPHPHDCPHSPQPPPKAAPEEQAAASVPAAVSHLSLHYARPTGIKCYGLDSLAGPWLQAGHAQSSSAVVISMTNIIIVIISHNSWALAQPAGKLACSQSATPMHSSTFRAGAETCKEKDCHRSHSFPCSISVPHLSVEGEEESLP